MGIGKGEQPRRITRLDAQPKSREAKGANLRGIVMTTSNLSSISTGSVLEDPKVDTGARVGTSILCFFDDEASPSKKANLFLEEDLKDSKVDLIVAKPNTRCQS